MERRLPHRRCMSPSSRAAPVRSSVRTPRVQTGLRCSLILASHWHSSAARKQAPVKT
jgi:hypothetical protein